MTVKEGDWVAINQLLGELHSAYAGGLAREPVAEQALFTLLQPVVARVAGGLARRYRWSRSLGETPGEIADTLASGTYFDLLNSFRRGKPPYLEESYVWQVARNYGFRSTERQQMEAMSLESTPGVLEVADRQPGVDEIVAGRQWRELPPEVREKLAQLFNAQATGVRARALRRRLMVLLHAPFIGDAGSGAWGLAVSSTALAGLLAAPIPTITDDRQVLASRLGLPTWDDAQAWFSATYIGSRLEIEPAPAQALLNNADHLATVRVLWPLLRLIQADGQQQRYKLASAQGAGAAVQWRLPGGAQLLLSVEAYGLWAGDRVTLRQVDFAPLTAAM